MRANYPPRVQALRKELITETPKVPNDRATAAHMSAFGTHQLMLVYLAWKMRLVPAKPRKVLIWSGGVDPRYFSTIRSQLQPLLGKVERGQDLKPHLSGLVHRRGFAVPEGSKEKLRYELDGVLTKTGLHHFHVGPITPSNPCGRSGRLVFADVTDDEFKIIAISNHDAFDTGSKEWSRLFGISRRYIQSQVPPGAAYLAYPTMSSGHPLELVLYANRCEELMMRLDARLEGAAFVDTLYSISDAAGSKLLERPAKPNLKWHFENLDFGLLERKTRVFFRMYFSPR